MTLIPREDLRGCTGPEKQASRIDSGSGCAEEKVFRLPDCEERQKL